LSLYLISPPSDKTRLRPLFRLLFNQFCRRLTEELNPPANKHRLLLLLDEFPSLGKLDFFEDALGFVAGYGLKALMINQSVNQIVKYYGTHNTVMDGAHVHVYYAPNTEETAKKISDLLGTKTEVHTQENFAGHRLAPWLGHIMVSRQQTARALLTPGEVRELPATDELLIVAGLPPIRAQKLRFHDDPMFKQCVPPTDNTGRLSEPNHPLNPPNTLSVRPYPYGPPAPAPTWRMPHAKLPAREKPIENVSGYLERTIGVDSDATASLASGGLENDADIPATPQPGIFGFDDHDRHRQANPDLGWNLPS
jgi:type IV secretion system protein VirD4